MEEGGFIALGAQGGYSTQSWVSTVKLIEKVIAVNLHTEGAVTFP